MLERACVGKCLERPRHSQTKARTRRPGASFTFLRPASQAAEKVEKADPSRAEASFGIIERNALDASLKARSTYPFLSFGGDKILKGSLYRLARNPGWTALG